MENKIYNTVDSMIHITKGETNSDETVFSQNTTTCCSNCGKIGHVFYQCKLPITSYGIIAFRLNESQIEYLMIRRKDSFGYIDFIRGKYSLSNVFQIQKCIDEMSMEEKERILTTPFSILWKNLWGTNTISLYKSEEASSCKKFEILQKGITINSAEISIRTLVENSDTEWNEQEWEFPKGRRNYKETDIECAIREFEEETGFNRANIDLVENIIPYEEYFIGSNFKAYKHKFYLAKSSFPTNDLTSFQKTEVSKMMWMNIDNCLSHIRPYNLEKKKIVSNIDKMLKEYSFYS